MERKSAYFVGTFLKNGDNGDDVRDTAGISPGHFFFVKTREAAMTKAEELAVNHPHFVVKLGKFTSEYSAAPRVNVRDIN